MSKAGFAKSVRMFRKFSEETLRRRGDNQLGREGVAALGAIESVLQGERFLDGTLLEPLSAFTNLLQSSQLPPEFGNYSFGDALLALEEAHAERRQDDEQVWEFEPKLEAEAAHGLIDFQLDRAPTGAPEQAPPLSGGPADEHAGKLTRYVLEGAGAAQGGWLVVSGALACVQLPLAELAARFERVTLSDLDLPRLEQLAERAIPKPLRSRVELERYDATGSYLAFTEGVEQAVKSATNQAQAVESLASLLQSYDVGAGSAGLVQAEGRPSLAISALFLSNLGRGYRACMRRALAGRGWDGGLVDAAPLGPALELLARLVEQHHIHALLRRAERALLISAVSELDLESLPNGASAALGEPRDLLGVEHLAERLPQVAQIQSEQSWEWRRPSADAAGKRSLLTLVEAVLV